jgi:hypothetical protein
LENAIVERKNRLASKENIAVRSENTIPKHYCPIKVQKN